METNEKIQEKVLKTIPRNIALLRKQSGMTQLELAEKLNYSDKAISKWERGEALPDIIVLTQISEFFGVSLDDLVHLDLSIANDATIITREKKQRSIANKCIIALMSAGLVWLIATVVFALIELIIPNQIPSFLAFIYAIPVSFIVLLVFSAIYRFQLITFICVSVLVWTLFTSVFVTMNVFMPIDNLWMLFVIPAAFQILVIFWFLRKRVVRKKKESNEVE